MRANQIVTGGTYVMRNGSERQVTRVGRNPLPFLEDGEGLRLVRYRIVKTTISGLPKKMTGICTLVVFANKADRRIG